MDPTYQAVLAAVVSFFIVSVIIATILMVCNESQRRQRSSSPRRDLALSKPKPTPNFGLSSISIYESATFDANLNRISMQELIEATKNFSPDLIVGDGSFGLVYKAQLKSGQTVAVKRLSADAFQGLREFRAEMETLGKIRHPNIVKLLGYCATGSDRVLIYEFMEKGSLDQWLYDTSNLEEEDCDKTELRLPLSWQIRMQIIRTVAKGLAYMHTLDSPIIHRDIKASNVLLNANFESHIADFGLARWVEGSHSHVSTQVAGTMGYMPPEYIHGVTVATVLGDVYSFGVLMLEIITGRRPSFAFTCEDGTEVRLMQWITYMAGQKRYMEMVDDSLVKDDLDERMVIEVFELGMKCADEKWKVRPRMKEVVEELDKILGI